MLGGNIPVERLRWVRDVVSVDPESGLEIPVRRRVVAIRCPGPVGFQKSQDRRLARRGCGPGQDTWLSTSVRVQDGIGE